MRQEEEVAMTAGLALQPFRTGINTFALSDLSHSYKLVLLKHREAFRLRVGPYKLKQNTPLPSRYKTFLINRYNDRTIRKMEETYDEAGGMFSLIFTQGAHSPSISATVF